MPKVKEENELTGLTLTQVKSEYFKLKKEHEKIVNGSYCHCCGKFLARDKFYVSSKTKSGLVPTCKRCLYVIGTGYNEKTKETNETVDTIKSALKLADLPFIQDVYESSMSAITDEASGKKRGTIFQQMIVMLQSLPQYKNMGWVDSTQIDEDDEPIGQLKLSKKDKLEAIKIFGYGRKDEDYAFLLPTFREWTERNDCQTISQETMYKRIAEKLLEIHKATLSGAPTKDLDKSFQDMLITTGIAPKQMNMDNIASDKTFGQLIRIWENEHPIPEPDDDFKDVDGIVHYISVWFLGHLCKMVGIKNRFARMYEGELGKYTVDRPEYDDDSEATFDAVFANFLDDPHKKDGEEDVE